MMTEGWNSGIRITERDERREGHQDTRTLGILTVDNTSVVLTGLDLLGGAGNNNPFEKKKKFGWGGVVVVRRIIRL